MTTRARGPERGGRGGVHLLAALILAGCATAPSQEIQAPSPSCVPIAFTNAVGVVGLANYSRDLDWRRIHDDLARAGFEMHPDPTAVAGRDPVGDPFSMTSAGAYAVRYPWNGSEPWPSETSEARAEASWRDVAPRFDASVASFENATGEKATSRSWGPDLVSGTGCTAER